MKMNSIGLIMVSTVMGVGWTTSPLMAQLQQPFLRQDKPAQEQTFAGKVDATDAAEKTLTVGGKQIYVVGSTHIMRGDKSITLGDVKAGDTVHGTSRQTFDGKTQAITIMVGMPDKG